MSKQNDGGPAFPDPGPADDSYVNWNHGMSLRDYFAAQALIGILAARNGFLVDVGTTNAAPWAYQIADAMLAEREKDGE